MKPLSSISVRIEQDSAKELKAVAREHRESQGKIVQRLIENFLRATPRERQAILYKGGSDLIQMLGSALELYAWGDHAFRKGWMVWSIETYAALADKAEGISGIQRLAWFRLGSSWMDLAMDLRDQALRQGSTSSLWNEYYSSAIDGLLLSIGYHRRFNVSLSEGTGQPQHPAILYNESCGWSLIAQYNLERAGGCAGEQACLARKHLDAGPKPKGQSVWIEAEMDTAGIRQVIRSLNPKVRTAITASIQNSLNKLDAIGTNRLRRSSVGVPIAQTNWLVAYAKCDPDLALVRLAEEDRFWSIIRAREMETTSLKEFNSLVRTAAAAVEHLVPDQQALMAAEQGE